MTFAHCQPCEMRASCQQMGRCCRPNTLDHCLREVQAAVLAMNAATNRLDAATDRLKSCLERENDGN